MMKICRRKLPARKKRLPQQRLKFKRNQKARVQQSGIVGRVGGGNIAQQSPLASKKNRHVPYSIPQRNLILQSLRHLINRRSTRSKLVLMKQSWTVGKNFRRHFACDGTKRKRQKRNCVQVQVHDSFNFTTTTAAAIRSTRTMNSTRCFRKMDDQPAFTLFKLLPALTNFEIFFFESLFSFTSAIFFPFVFEKV